MFPYQPEITIQPVHVLAQLKFIITSLQILYMDMFSSPFLVEGYGIPYRN